MRLVTRGDLDGLACAVIITSHEPIREIVLIHPQDITEGRADIHKGDIIANLPYHRKCSKWFDHHMFTATPVTPPEHFEGVFAEAPSAAGLVYSYYGGSEAMPQYEELIAETDRLDSAMLEVDDIVNPHRFIKLGFTLDSRTGLGKFEAYFRHLLNLFKRGLTIEEILQQPAVSARCDKLDKQNEAFGNALLEHSRVDGNVVITDFRALEDIPVGNRFLIYALFPKTNVSIRLHWGPERKYPIALLGHSILNRTCQTNVGNVAARYGGGGHRGAGSMPLADGEVDAQVQMIVAELKANG